MKTVTELLREFGYIDETKYTNPAEINIKINQDEYEKLKTDKGL